MANDSIDLNFNLSGPSGGANNHDLVSSLNSLVNKLTSFEATMAKFVSGTKAYSTASSGSATLAEARLVAARASDKRATFNSTERGQAFRQTSLSNSSLNAQTRFIREQAISSLKTDSKSAFDRGDAKEGRRLQTVWENAISKGTQNALKNSWSKIGGFGGALYGGKLIAGQLSSNFALNAQIGLAAMANPLTNNYDYGSPVSKVLQTAAQHNYSNIGLGMTGAGAAIGGLFGGPVGFGIGASVGSSIGQVYGAQGNAQAQIQAEAIGNYINQRMTNEALQGSNAAAAGLMTSVHGVMGNKFSIGKGDDKTELDPTMPLAREVSKGAAVYNRNYKEVETLTNYAIAAQVPMAQLGKLGQTASLMNLTKSEIGSMANLATNYGIGLPELADRAFVFQQAGMGKDAAMTSAVKSFQQTSGFQSAQQSFYGGFTLDRKMQNMIGSAFGVSMEAAYDVNNPGHAAAVKKLNAMSASSSITENAKAKALGWLPGYNNPNNPTGTDMNAGGSLASMNPTSNTMRMLHLAESTSINAKNQGSVDAGEITKAMGAFAQDLSGSTVSLTNFKNVLDEVTDKIKEVGTRKRSVAAVGKNDLYVVQHMVSGSTNSKINSK